MKPTDSFGGANQLSRQPRHILVVENDNWEYFEMLLAEAEPTLTLTHTPDGYEALRLLQEHQFDLVWTDLMHPGPSGFELLRWLRANQPNLPVIVVTGYPSDSSECQQAFSLGGDRLGK
jgi:CheY-like chemotaxis protein